MHCLWRKMHALTVAWQNPLEAIVQQSSQRFLLLGPRVPAIIAKGDQSPFVAVPSQMIAREEVAIVIEQHHVARRVAGRGYGEKAGGHLDASQALQHLLGVRLGV